MIENIDSIKMLLGGTAPRRERHDSHLTSHRSLVTNHSPSEGGFTLIEIAVVLFLMTVVLAFTLPTMTFGESLAAATRHLAGAVRTTHFAAASAQRVHRLYLDLNEQTYWIVRVEPDGERPPLDAQLAGQMSLPRGIRFLDVFSPQSGTVTSGQISLRFLPVGRTDQAVIRLADQNDNILALELNPVTNSTRILDRPQDPLTKEPVPDRLRSFLLPPPLQLSGKP